MRRSALRVALIADSRHPITEPFAGGLQSMTWHLARGLLHRGMEVCVFAAPGSDPQIATEQLTVSPVRLSRQARADVSMRPVEWIEQHHAYLRLMLDLSRRPGLDVVHNNSLHYLPVAMAESLSTPLLTTLHTPPTPWLEPAVEQDGCAHSHFAAVSEFTARQWAHVTEASVVRNGIDTDAWSQGPGGEELVWFGRIVPEKGLHLALDVAELAGRRLLVAGPVGDRGYWDEWIAPRLGDRAVYLGHLRQRDLADLVGRCAAALVTPEWDEPFGLVAAEALSCGTPVAGFSRGGLPEVIDDQCGRLVPGGDVAAAAEAVSSAARLDRRSARRRAVSACSVDAMVESYLRLYGELGKEWAA